MRAAHAPEHWRVASERWRHCSDDHDELPAEPFLVRPIRLIRLPFGGRMRLAICACIQSDTCAALILVAVPVTAALLFWSTDAPLNLQSDW